VKVGDCVKVDYIHSEQSKPLTWIGICTWTDGYKFEFVIDGEFDTWTKSDLETVGAEVVNENW
jgi:hypothetical protein